MMREATAARPGQNRSSPRPIGVDEASRTSWLLCRAGAVLCALPIEHVIEIMRLLPVEQIGGAPKYVCGLSVIRGAPVPVVDLGLIIGDQITPCMRLIAMRAATRTVALAVEAVIGISAIAADAFGQLPPLLRDAAADTVTAIGTSDTELIIFLRAARLVPEEVLAGLDADGALS
jgi:purine-binding chemotaxis protein CheW